MSGVIRRALEAQYVMQIQKIESIHKKKIVYIHENFGPHPCREFSVLQTTYYSRTERYGFRGFNKRPTDFLHPESGKNEAMAQHIQEETSREVAQRNRDAYSNLRNPKRGGSGFSPPEFVQLWTPIPGITRVTPTAQV